MTKKTPLVLAFDTSKARCDVALVRGDVVLAHRQVEMEKGQAEKLMDLCADVLQDGSTEMGTLDAIGVGIGPGNFTGIRISVSAARGLALGLQIPAVGVSIFDALRYGVDGACVCTTDARRGQHFVQSFDDAGQASDPRLMDETAVQQMAVPLIGSGGARAKHPTAVAIAFLTAARVHVANQRPAPLYLRPADAAPAKDAPPTILP